MNVEHLHLFDRLAANVQTGKTKAVVATFEQTSQIEELGRERFLGEIMQIKAFSPFERALQCLEAFVQLVLARYKKSEGKERRSLTM